MSHVTGGTTLRRAPALAHSATLSLVQAIIVLIKGQTPSNTQLVRCFQIIQDVVSRSSRTLGTLSRRGLCAAVLGWPAWHETANQQAMLRAPAVGTSSGAKTGSHARSENGQSKIKWRVVSALDRTGGILGGAVDHDVLGGLLSSIYPSWRASVTKWVSSHRKCRKWTASLAMLNLNFRYFHNLLETITLISRWRTQHTELWYWQPW